MGIFRELTARRLRYAVVLSLAVAAGSALAGDETDYSAPYVTVENGELVTRYPAKKHAGTETGAQSLPAPAGEAAGSGAPARAVPPLFAALVAAGVVIAVPVVVLVVVRRRAANRSG